MKKMGYSSLVSSSTTKGGTSLIISKLSANGPFWPPQRTQVHSLAHFILKKKKKKTRERESKTKKTKRDIGSEFYKLTHEAKKIKLHIFG